MAKHSPLHTRRAFLAATGFLIVPTVGFAASRRAAVVTILGDSITAGLGLPASQSLPAQLQIALRKLKPGAVVRGAGVSGDTTAGGLARVGFSVQGDTDLCIVALGGNDLLQGVDPKVTQANLDAIVKKLKARRIKVLIAGLAAPGDLGGAYAREFAAVFPAVARANGVAVYPNLLAGVALDEKFNQGDGIHPNAEGVKIVARGLAPAVARAL
jgi:acyl-CoA thioesterase-1